MNYADPFGIQEATPLSRALRRIELVGSQHLNWPAGYLGPDYIASINLVVPSQENCTINLPDALGANEGTGFLMINKGNYAFNVLDFSGSVISSLIPGQAKYIYCESNDTENGDWHTVTFGEGVSTNDANELAGMGLDTTDGKLNMAIAVSTSASDVNVSAQHRSKLLVNNGGNVSINLPQYNTVGNNFFFSLHNGGSGTTTIKPATDNKIDDYDSLALAPNESVIVCCSGTSKWYTIGYGRSTQFQFTKLVKDVSDGGTIVLTSAEASNKLLQFTGSPASNVIIIVPSIVGIYYVQNTYSGPNTLTLKTQSGVGLSLSSNDRAIVYCDGVNIVSAQSVAVGVNLSVVDGSTSIPSISFSSDPNTGIFKSDLDTLGITSDGVAVATFNNRKSAVGTAFGVGTFDPAVPFHVSSLNSEIMRLEGLDGYMSFYNGNTRTAVIRGLSKELRLSAESQDSILTLFAAGSRKVEVNANGLKVYGGITDENGNTFASTNANTFSGLQVIPVQRGKLLPAPAPVGGVLTLDVSKTNCYSYTVTGAIRIDFTGKPPAGQEQTIYVKLRNGGTNVTYGSMCQFTDSGLRPTLTGSGVDVLAIWYDTETDCYVIGRAFKDYRP